MEFSSVQCRSYDLARYSALYFLAIRETRNAKIEAAAPGSGGSRYKRVELALNSAEQLKRSGWRRAAGGGRSAFAPSEREVAPAPAPRPISSVPKRCLSTDAVVRVRGSQLAKPEFGVPEVPVVAVAM